MQFRTSINILPSSLTLDHSRRVMMIGSCFAEHIAERMQRAGFHIVSNPFGIMFNPASIAQTIERLASVRSYSADDLTLSGERWVSFDFHGDFASRNAEEAVERMNRAVEQGIPFTNYGTAIAHINGILQRSLSLFPALQQIVEGE